MIKNKVLMVGSETTVRGGMTTVVLEYLGHDFKNTKITYMITHYNLNIIKTMLKFLINIPKLIKNINNNDIIHMHMSERGSFIRKYIIFKLSKRRNKKVIVHMHGAEFKEYYSGSNKNIKSKIRELLTGCDYVLTLGDNWNNYVKSIDLNIKCRIFRNSVPVNDYKVSLKDEYFNILFLAIIDKRKGIYDLVECVNILIKQYSGNKKIKFIIAGSGKDERNIKELVHKYKIEEYFEFKGWISNKEKHKVLKNSHLFVLPSYNEGLPLSILEAMSYGLPIISTNVGSIDEAVIDDINGFLLEPGDVRNLVNSIMRIINNDEIWKKFSLKSKSICTLNFDDNKYFEDVEKLYDSIMEENKCKIKN